MDIKIIFYHFKYVLRGVWLSFRSFSGTAREVKVFEQHFIVSDSISCRLPATVHTRLTNRKVLSWIRNVTGKNFNALSFGVHTPKHVEKYS